MSGARISWVAASARLGPSCPPLARGIWPVVVLLGVVQSSLLLSHRPPGCPAERTQDCGQRSSRSHGPAHWSPLVWGRRRPLGIAAGGLGARCAAEHAPAAYDARFSACRELCGQLWPAFDPFDLDEGCHLAAAEEALRSAIPSGANIYAESDSPSQQSLSGMIEAQSVSGILGTPPFLDTAVCTSRLAGFRVVGLGSPPTRRALIPTFLHPFSEWLSSAVFVCHCGITTRRVACVGRCWTVGVITPSPVAAVETGFCAIARSAMWSAPRSRSSRQSRLNLRNLASSSPRGRLILEVPTPMSTPLLYLPLRLPLVAALPISGFPGAFLASLKPGTSRFLRCSAPLTSPGPLLLWPMSSMRWKPGSAPCRTRLHWLLSAGPPSAHSSWRLAGAVGPKPFGVLWLGLPPSPSRTARGLATDLPKDNSLRIAQRISCTLHRENARAILRRSPGSVNGSTGLAGDHVPASGG